MLLYKFVNMSQIVGIITYPVFGEDLLSEAI